MSLSENLHNLGALLKTNLETKGINGLTGNEGLTTLANKILDIEGSGSSSKSVVACVTGNSVTLGSDGYRWLPSIGSVVIDWGDGTSDTINNPSTSLSHTYTNANGHLIAFNGNITSLGDSCFERCSGLTGIIIPDSITGFGEGSFALCSGLTNIIIPNSVTSLGNVCFSNCSGLTSIIIPSSVTNIGGACFNRCFGLTSVIIPDSITSIEESCFSECSSLTSVVIPDSVTSIGEGCFAECSSLTSVVIPDSVTSIGASCFYGCSSLIDYELYWRTQPVTYDSAKMPVNNGTVFTIPQGTTSIYTDAGYPVANLVERVDHYNLVLSSTTPIIQTGDSATVTASLTHNNAAASGKTLNYFITYDDGTLNILDSGSVITDSNGEASITYTGTGIGDVSVEVSYGNLLQETYVVQDCFYWNDGSSVTGLEIDSGVSCTSNSDYITITTSTNSEKYVTIPTAPTGDWEFETTLAEYGDTNYMTFVMPTSYRWCQVGYDAMMTVDIGNGENRHGITLSKGAVLKVTYINGTMSVYYDNTLIESNQVSATGKIGYYTNRNRIQHIKDIKLKALVEQKSLDNLTLSSTTPIIQTGDSAIVTASLTNNGVAVSDKTLNYTVKHGSTTIDTGTITTGSDGKASMSYTGTGIGDVTFEVTYGTLLQETFVVEDCQFYDSLTSNSGHWSIPSDVTLGYNEYSNDGWKLGNASKYVKIPSDFYVTFPFKLSFILNDRYSYSPTVHIGENYYIELDYNKVEIQGTRLPHTQINGAEYSFIVRSDSVTAYCNNNLVGSVNVSFDTTDNNLKLAIGNNRFFQMKDLKVKALNYDLVLSSTSPIIQKTETAIVNAVLTLDNVAVSSETLNYVVKHGSTTIDSGTVITNSNGEASISYTGTGIGDVSVEVSYGNLLQETYELEDCKLFDASSQENISLYTTTGTINYDSNEQAYYYPPQNFVYMYRDSFVVDFDFELTLEFKLSSKPENQTFYFGLSNEHGGNNNYDIQIQIVPFFNKIGAWYRNTVIGQSISNRQTDCNYSLNMWYTLKLIRQDSSFTVQILENGNVIGSSTNNCANSIDATSLRILSEEGYFYFKNIKVKAL